MAESMDAVGRAGVPQAKTSARPAPLPEDFQAALYSSGDSSAKDEWIADPLSGMAIKTNDEGLPIAMTPDPTPAFAIAQTTSGGWQTMAGISLAVAGGPLTATIGVATAAIGLDNTVHGVATLASSKHQPTLKHQLLKTGAEAAGLNDGTATGVAISGEFALDLALGVGGALAASRRAVGEAAAVRTPPRGWWRTPQLSASGSPAVDLGAEARVFLAAQGQDGVAAARETLASRFFAELERRFGREVFDGGQGAALTQQVVAALDEALASARAVRLDPVLVRHAKAALEDPALARPWFKAKEAPVPDQLTASFQIRLDDPRTILVPIGDEAKVLAALQARPEPFQATLQQLLHGGVGARSMRIQKTSDGLRSAGAKDDKDQGPKSEAPLCTSGQRSDTPSSFGQSVKRSLSALLETAMVMKSPYRALSHFHFKLGNLWDRPDEKLLQVRKDIQTQADFHVPRAERLLEEGDVAAAEADYLVAISNLDVLAKEGAADPANEKSKIYAKLARVYAALGQKDLAEGMRTQAALFNAPLAEESTMPDLAKEHRFETALRAFEQLVSKARQSSDPYVKQALLDARQNFQEVFQTRNMYTAAYAKENGLREFARALRYLK